MLTQTELDRFVAEQEELDHDRRSLQQIHDQQMAALAAQEARRQSYGSGAASSLAGVAVEMVGTAAMALVGALAVLAIFG